MRALIVTILSGFWLSGCTQYQYRLTEPPQPPADVPHKIGLSVNKPPLSYSLLVVDDRLSMRIDNSADEPIRIDGERSYVVDTTGQTHPLPGRTIAPYGYVALTIPPVRPLYRIGSHTYSGTGPRYHGNASGPNATSIVLDDNLGYYWDWQGAGTFRVVITYWRGNQMSVNDFTFERQRV